MKTSSVILLIGYFQLLNVCQTRPIPKTEAGKKEPETIFERNAHLNERIEDAGAEAAPPHAKAVFADDVDPNAGDYLPPGTVLIVEDDSRKSSDTFSNEKGTAEKENGRVLDQGANEDGKDIGYKVDKTVKLSEQSGGNKNEESISNESPPNYEEQEGIDKDQHGDHTEDGNKKHTQSNEASASKDTAEKKKPEEIGQRRDDKADDDKIYDEAKFIKKHEDAADDDKIHEEAMFIKEPSEPIAVVKLLDDDSAPGQAAAKTEYSEYDDDDVATSDQSHSNDEKIQIAAEDIDNKGFEADGEVKLAENQNTKKVGTGKATEPFDINDLHLQTDMKEMSENQRQIKVFTFVILVLVAGLLVLAVLALFLAGSKARNRGFDYKLHTDA